MEKGTPESIANGFDLHDLLFGTPPDIALGGLDEWMRAVPPEELHRVAALGVVTGTGFDAAFGPDHASVVQISRTVFGPIALELDSRGFEFPAQRPHLDYWFLDWCAHVATAQSDKVGVARSMVELRSLARSALRRSFPDPRHEIRPFLCLIERLLGGIVQLTATAPTLAGEGVVRHSRALPIVERFGLPTSEDGDASGPPTSIFISYTGDDDRFHDCLIKHLSPLVRTGDVEVWSDRRLRSGDEFEPEILRRLNTADIVIPLLSPSFVASDYCYEKELPIALARHRSGQAHILPVVVRPFHWRTLPIAKLQLLPTRAKPVVEWAIEDNAWVAIVRELESRVRRQHTHRRSAQKGDE